ncbi:MAG: tRNA pseudouridine(55) synthase TruB [Eubacteriales bacterium]|nr:tRNA pseudouridine(55) synthase TruB [Eubacteriales bacterium]
MDGIIIINKEEGFTSHDVVAKLRGILRMKKIGHTGTLDPMATGVLPVCIGQGTRLVELLTDKKKTYRAVLHLGVTTDTQDCTGTILEERPIAVTEEELQSTVASFLGEYWQVPPMYSALKVNGKRLYELAREGKEVERAARRVEFYDIQIQKVAFPFVTMEVTCSKGTYIRTLCHDIGEKLGCGGCMEELQRTGTGGYTLLQSHTLSEVETYMKSGRIDEILIPVQEVLKEYPILTCIPSADRLLDNGNPLSAEQVSGSHKDGWTRMCRSDGRFMGIFQWEEKRQKYLPVRMFPGL